TGHLRVRRYLTYCTPPPLRFKGKRGKKHEKKLMQLCCAANNFTDEVREILETFEKEHPTLFSEQ
ncbi:hypothetical protein, partial [Enterococcus faecium]|uniref:hypothetical protein n=1 Tax=Enterococcus faecium TaxID=1352 RepID=UPI00292E169A